MEIDRIFYPVKTLGYGERIGIWTVGCPHRCKGCSNPELWEKDPEKDMPVGDIIKIIEGLGTKADGITITGGEPFLQPKELNFLVSRLNQIGYNDILIYTGYTYDELVTPGNSLVTNIFAGIAALVDGKYIDVLNDNKPLRGSSNQNLMILNEKYAYQYNQNEKIRTVQNIFYKNRLLSIGIPVKGFRRNMGRALRKTHIMNG